MIKITDTIKENNEMMAGKHVLNSFLKMITSLGLSDIRHMSEKIIDNFLIFFEYKTEYQHIIDRMERFPSLMMFIEKVPKYDGVLYYGISNEMNFEFGFLSGLTLIVIGKFKITNSTFKYLTLIESSSASHLKKELAYLNLNTIQLYCNVHKFMNNYHPGKTHNRTFRLFDGNLEYGYQGIGKWENGIITNLTDIKNNAIEYLRNFQGHQNLLLSVLSEDNNWIKCIIKIK